MNESDRDSLALALDFLSRFYRQENNDQMIHRAYFEALTKYKMIEIRQAIKGHMSNPDEGRFYPKPAHLIAEINKIKKPNTYRKQSKAITHKKESASNETQESKENKWLVSRLLRETIEIIDIQDDEKRCERKNEIIKNYNDARWRKNNVKENLQ